MSRGRLFGRQVDPLKLKWKNDLPMARSCGDCTACCTAPEIEEKGFHKPMGVPCVHLCESGCGIYGQDERPRACMGFACNWLRGDGTIHQRPDRMGAVPTLSADRRQCVLYLAEHVDPENIRGELRSYIRHWHRKRGTAVLLIHGEGYQTMTAIWPDGSRQSKPTEVVKPEQPGE